MVNDECSFVLVPVIDSSRTVSSEDYERCIAEHEYEHKRTSPAPSLSLTYLGNGGSRCNSLQAVKKWT